MKVLICLPGNAPAAARASVAARVAHTKPVVASTFDDLLSARARAEGEGEKYVIVTTTDHLAHARSLLEESRYCKDLVFLTGAMLGPELCRNLLEARYVKHLLPLTEDLATDLGGTLRRLASPEFWPLARYLNPACLASSFDVRTQEHKRAGLEEMEARLQELGADDPETFGNNHMGEIFVIADELLSNALNITRPELKTHPTAAFRLDGDEVVRFEWAFDGTRFGLAVTDRVGGLSAWTFRDHVFGKEKEAGSKRVSAGIGLRTAVKRSHILVASVVEDSYTCVQAVMTLDRSMKVFETRPKRVEFFNT